MRPFGTYWVHKLPGHRVRWGYGYRYCTRTPHFLMDFTTKQLQEAQLSQTDRDASCHWIFRSRSYKLVLFESFGTVSYVPSIVTMALSCIVCEIKRDIGRKSRFFLPPAFDVAVRGSLSEYCHTVWSGKTGMVGLPDGENVWCLAVSIDTGVWWTRTDWWTVGWTDILRRHSPRYA